MKVVVTVDTSEAYVSEPWATETVVGCVLGETGGLFCFAVATGRCCIAHVDFVFEMAAPVTESWAVVEPVEVPAALAVWDS